MGLTNADLRAIRAEAQRRAPRPVTVGTPRLLELLELAGAGTVAVDARDLERIVALALRRQSGATSDPPTTLTPSSRDRGRRPT